jgi:putative ABC transport system permease protein
MSEHFRAAWEGMRSNQLRSVLTMLGVAVGVATVIAVVSIAQGLSVSIGANFNRLGANSLTVHSYTSFDDQLRGKLNRLSLSDYEALRRSVASVARLTPVLMPFGPFGAGVSYNNRATGTRIEAVSADMQETFNLYTNAGRFFTTEDVAGRRRVCVLGSEVLRKLGLSNTAIGRYIRVDTEWFKIIGVMETRGDLFGVSQDDYVLVPFSVGAAMFPDETKHDVAVILNANREADLPAIKDAAERTLRHSSLRSREPGTEDPFRVETAEQLSSSLSTISRVVTFALAAILSVTLLVAGIGIMNIMLVSVRERTREIGILKALGARRSDILWQFLLEAMLLSSFGGGIGIAFGCLLAHAASVLLLALPAPITPAWSVAGALSFAFLVGGVFGVLPAAQAANLRPVEALKQN